MPRGAAHPVPVGAPDARPGLIDYLSLTDVRAVRTATVHLTLNLVIVGLFIANLVLRSTGYPAPLPLVLSAIGVGLLVVSGWFGWQLIYARLSRDRAAHAGAAGRGVDVSGPD